MCLFKMFSYSDLEPAEYVIEESFIKVLSYSYCDDIKLFVLSGHLFASFGENSITHYWLADVYNVCSVFIL